MKAQTMLPCWLFALEGKRSPWKEGCRCCSLKPLPKKFGELTEERDSKGSGWNISTSCYSANVTSL